MITARDFVELLVLLDDQGRADVRWAEGLSSPANADEFALELIFVICNSGMKYGVARGIFERVRDAIIDGQSATEVFGHKHKTASIDEIWAERNLLFRSYCALQSDEQKLRFLEDLPHIGSITKYHAAKNFGLDVCKPDVHLQRLADREGVTAQVLCERLQRDLSYVGRKYKVATIDTILWRACADGILDSKTGQIRREAAHATRSI